MCFGLGEKVYCCCESRLLAETGAYRWLHWSFWRRDFFFLRRWSCDYQSFCTASAATRYSRSHPSFAGIKHRECDSHACSIPDLWVHWSIHSWVQFRGRVLFLDAIVSSDLNSSCLSWIDHVLHTLLVDWKSFRCPIPPFRTRGSMWIASFDFFLLRLVLSLFP